MADVTANIRIQDLLNTSLARYRYTTLIGTKFRRNAFSSLIRKQTACIETHYLHALILCEANRHSHGVVDTKHPLLSGPR